jgi:hypothetical protein
VLLRPGHPGGRRRGGRRVHRGLRAVLALSILLAALCLFALAGIARALTPGRAVMSE